MASEDSDQLGSGFLAIHGLRDLGDLRETSGGQMKIVLHHAEHPNELVKVRPLGRVERMLLEERHDGLKKIPSVVHDVLAHVLAMIIVPGIRVNLADPEKLAELFKASNAAHALRHDEPRRDLIAELVAASTNPIVLSDEAD